MIQLVKALKELKLLGVSAVKQSTEDEGSTFKNIKLMRSITKKAKINLNVKIGGCEAKNDILFCKDLKVDSIIAPMIESKYALKKFTQFADINKNCLHLFMLETKLAFHNLDEILNSSSFKLVDGIVVGRSDFTESFTGSKEKINSDFIFKKIEICLNKIKKKNTKKFICKMGGSISKASINFVKKLFDKNLLHYIETRNVEIKLSKKTLNNLDLIISKIFEFEILWLNYQLKTNQKKNSLKYQIDKYRLNEIKNRYKSNKF